MDIPTKAERLELWKITFARSSFIQASRACHAMLRFVPNGTEVLISALSTAALVFYARPFKQSEEVKLEKTYVPSDFLAFHEDIILYRDKVVSHRDVKGPKTPWGTANDIVFASDGSSFEILTDSPILEPAAATRLANLSDALVGKMDAALNPIVKRFLSTRLAHGRHVLNLKGDDPQWLKPEP